MSEKIAWHQLFEYSKETPFHFYAVVGNADSGNLLLNHWHEELEIAYALVRGTKHYINGECDGAYPGRLIVTNSEFIHNIIQDKCNSSLNEVVTPLVIVYPKFIINNFQKFQNIYSREQRAKWLA